MPFIWGRCQRERGSRVDSERAVDGAGSTSCRCRHRSGTIPSHIKSNLSGAKQDIDICSARLSTRPTNLDVIRPATCQRVGDERCLARGTFIVAANLGQRREARTLPDGNHRVECAAREIDCQRGHNGGCKRVPDRLTNQPTR